MHGQTCSRERDDQIIFTHSERLWHRIAAFFGSNSACTAIRFSANNVTVSFCSGFPGQRRHTFIKVRQKRELSLWCCHVPNVGMSITTRSGNRKPLPLLGENGHPCDNPGRTLNSARMRYGRLRHSTTGNCTQTGRTEGSEPC